MGQMLARARKKSKNLPIRWIQADVRSFYLNEQFRLITDSTGTFEHLLARKDQQAMLARVHEHLEPLGCFIVATVFPREFLMRNSTEDI